MSLAAQPTKDREPDRRKEDIFTSTLIHELNHYVVSGCIGHDDERWSMWTGEAVHWMAMHGVITGMSDGTLAPKDNATRAQIATMFMRFAEEMAK